MLARLDAEFRADESPEQRDSRGGGPDDDFVQTATARVPDLDRPRGRPASWEGGDTDRGVRRVGGLQAHHVQGTDRPVSRDQSVGSVRDHAVDDFDLREEVGPRLGELPVEVGEFRSRSGDE